MKILFLSFLTGLCTLAVTSCNSRKAVDLNQSEISIKDKYRRLDSIKAAQIKSGPIIDTTFLGFVFGMNPDKFSNHCEYLEKTGLLFKDVNSNIPYFHFVRDKYKRLHKGQIYIEFSSGNLGVVGLQFNNLDSPETVYLDVINAYWDKYGTPHVIIQGPKSSSSGKYFWVLGNQEISIEKADSNVFVKYSDLRIKENIYQLDSINKAEAHLSTMNNI